MTNLDGAPEGAETKAHKTQAGETAERVQVHDRLVGTTCLWCGAGVLYRGHGRRPRYCGRVCRQRAYEARTADRRTTAAAMPRQEPVREVIERTVTRTVVHRAEPPQAAAADGPATWREWARLLETLAGRLEGPEDPLHREHWQHARLTAALQRVELALDQAHPGGLAHILNTSPH